VDGISRGVYAAHPGCWLVIFDILGREVNVLSP